MYVLHWFTSYSWINFLFSLFFNRCSNCFDCPSCMHTLSTRATSAQVPDPQDPSKTISKKVYYLICGFCRWTSRDVGIPDQTTGIIILFIIIVVKNINIKL